MVWAFTDCVAKKGPKLITADKSLIGCDPVSGRASEVNLCWEQLCVADAYDIEIAKDKDFTLRIIDFTEEGNSGIMAYLCQAMRPVDVLKPCVFFPAGGAAMAEYVKGAIGKIEIPMLSLYLESDRHLTLDSCGCLRRAWLPSPTSSAVIPTTGELRCASALLASGPAARGLR